MCGIRNEAISLIGTWPIRVNEQKRCFASLARKKRMQSASLRHRPGYDSYRYCVGPHNQLCCASCSMGRSDSTEIPSVEPENPSMYAKLTPMTSPLALNTGPPLPPWAVGAS
jgi:hypothetical protein